MQFFRITPVAVALVAMTLSATALTAAAAAEPVNRAKYPVKGLVVVASPGTTTPPKDGGSQNPGDNGGTEQPPAPGVLVASPGSLSFGTVPVGQLSATQAVTVQNTGTGSLTISSLGIASGADVFAQSNNCGSTLAASASCTVQVRYAPSAAGGQGGSLAILASNGTSKLVSLSGAGEVGTASISSLDFGTVDVGSSLVYRSVVSNTGHLAWALTPPDASTVTGDGFTFASTTCGSSLSPSATCDVNVKFAPSSAGAKAGYLQVQTSLGTQVAHLSGVARHFALSSSPSALDFGSVHVGQLSSVKTITLNNTGSEALTVSGLDVVGSTRYAQSNNCGSQLASGASCVVSVQFAPTATGPINASLGVTVAGVSPVTVSLAGKGVQGQASVSPSSLDFGTQRVNIATAAQQVTLTNTGDDVLTVSSVQVSAGTTDFAQTNNCTSVPVNGSCTISTTFKPTVDGARTGTITVAHNGIGTGSTTISLSGTGSSPALNVSLAKTTVDSSGFQHYGLNFGNSGLNAASPAQTFTLTASGSAVALTSVAIYTGNPEYTASHNCGTTLADGASCTVTVNLTPFVAGTRVGSIRITGSLGTSVVDLTTNALQTTATAAPAAGLTYASTFVGSTSANQTVTVNNTGDYPLTVSSATLETGSTDFVVSTNGCTTVAARGSCTISVAFKPSAAGTRTGSLAIANNSSTAKLTVPLTGTGAVPTFAIGLTKTTVDGNGWQHYGFSFGNTTLNMAAPAQTFTITAGSSAVTFSMLGIYTGNPEYKVSHNCGTSLAAGAACTVTVNLTPYIVGTRIGTIRIITNLGTSVVDLTTTAN